MVRCFVILNQKRLRLNYTQIYSTLLNSYRYVHLAARPQVNLLSVGRKRFAHLSDVQDEIHVEENVPWGEDTLFTLEFREEANKYAIHTCNNMYLQKDGKLVPSVNKVNKYTTFVYFFKV